MIYFIFIGICFIIGGIIKIIVDIPLLFILCGLFGVILFFIFLNLILHRSTSIATPPPKPSPPPTTPVIPCVATPAPAGKSYAWIWISLVALIIAGLIFYSANKKPESNDDAISKKTPSEGTLVDPHESWQDYIMSRGLL